MPSAALETRITRKTRAAINKAAHKSNKQKLRDAAKRAKK